MSVQGREEAVMSQVVIFSTVFLDEGASQRTYIQISLELCQGHIPEVVAEPRGHCCTHH